MMMKRFSIFVIGAMLLAGCSQRAKCDDQLSIIPQPTKVDQMAGCFTMTPQLSIVCDSSFDFDIALEQLNNYLEPIFHKNLSVIRSDEPLNGFFNVFCDPTLPSEGYRLRVDQHGVMLEAGSSAGALYGVETWRQLLPHINIGVRYDEVEIPFLEIEDAPRMKYRGVMLDVARHFFTVEEVEEVIDIMAMHKFNRLHLHLTDDQGWRIEIKAYPRLTEFGSIRQQTIIGRDPNGEYDASTPFDNTPYGGFYTQDDIRHLVDYAARHAIEVIPEIEFPGHAVAALASYPSLSCTQEQYEVRQSWDIDDRVFCVGRESTFAFMENVLKEVIDLFPSEYIHIGGDECPTKMWAKCAHCQTLMHREHLTSLRELQGYATRRVEQFLMEHHRKLIAWDEVLDGGVTPSTIVMSWRGTEGGVKAARQGNSVVMSPTTYCYFDYYQSEAKDAEPLAWGGFLPVEKVYEFDPCEGLTAKECESVLGVQANLWTEYIPTLCQAEYMLLPRLAALSEVGWCVEKGSFDDFKQRLPRLVGLYDYSGYNYAKHVME